MKTKVIIGIVAILIFAIGLATMSSNMGFKLSRAVTANVSDFIALPYYNSLSTQTAQYLRLDAIASGGAGVQVYNWNGTVWQRYAGGGAGQVNFPITPGLGYQVKSTVDMSNWVIVGSHNPSTTIPVTANVSAFIAVPYHTTCGTAQYLRLELMAQGGTGVQVYSWNGTVWQRYAGGGAGQVNFNIVPGSAYQAKSTADIAAYLPSHY